MGFVNLTATTVPFNSAEAAVLGDLESAAPGRIRTSRRARRLADPVFERRAGTTQHTWTATRPTPPLTRERPVQPGALSLNSISTGAMPCYAQTRATGELTAQFGPFGPPSPPAIGGPSGDGAPAALTKSADPTARLGPTMARILVVEPVAQPGLDALSAAHDSRGSPRPVAGRAARPLATAAAGTRSSSARRRASTPSCSPPARRD